MAETLPAPPTVEGKVLTKKDMILKFCQSNPHMTASDIAEKLKTTKGYVWKVRSIARRQGKVLRGRNDRLFAHGKVFYEDFVDPRWINELKAIVVNQRTGLRQIGFRANGDPCSCQLHANGHVVIFPRFAGWRSWLVDALTKAGWDYDRAQLLVHNCQLTVKVAECGVKPADSSILPADLYLETEWGVIVCRDNSPQKGALELKLHIPRLQQYLGVPDILKRLETLEKSSLTMNQRQMAIEALLHAIFKLLQKGDHSIGSDRT